MLRALPFLLVALAVGLSACARDPIQRGTNLYADGQYIEAAEVFERTEHRLPNLSAEDQARYGLYRGLTLLVLGDLRGAHHWFSYAGNMERRHPGSLGQQRALLLERGAFELGNRIRQTPAPPGVSTAIAATPPAIVAPPANPPVPPPAPQPGNESLERRSLMP